jgi:hypothetical protein
LAFYTQNAIHLVIKLGATTVFALGNGKLPTYFTKEIPVHKVAVFGNAGGGKSTLRKRLAEITGLPMVALDRLKYKAGGGEVPYEDYKAAHDQLLQQDQWIIDGYGSLDTVWERPEIADTLVYVDMPILRHYWWMTKRFLKGFLVPPENWPENSLSSEGKQTGLSSSVSSTGQRVLSRC